MDRLIHEFTATDDQGKEYRLRVRQDEIPVNTRENPSAVTGGLKSIVTDDGRKVNRLGKGRYEIAVSGIILTSSDPDAI